MPSDQIEPLLHISGHAALLFQDIEEAQMAIEARIEELFEPLKQTESADTRLAILRGAHDMELRVFQLLEESQRLRLHMIEACDPRWDLANKVWEYECLITELLEGLIDLRAHGLRPPPSPWDLYPPAEPQTADPLPG